MEDKIENCGTNFIRNKTNDRMYVGSSIDIRKRLWNHTSALRNNHHDNEYLQRAWNKHGEDNFETGILLNCAVENLLPQEQIWIDRIRGEDRHYNIAIVAGAGMRGRKHTPEAIEKTASAHRGKIVSEETRKKLSDAHMGKIQQPHTEEQKIGIAVANTGKKTSEETLEKQRAAHKGKIISADQRIKNGISKSSPIYAIHEITKDKVEYRSFLQAENMGLNRSSISRAIRSNKSYNDHY